MKKLGLAALAAAMLVAPPALAQSSTLVLVIGGEAYDGPPKFEVLFNGQKLGEGVVDVAIDTATTGRFAEANVKTPYIQSFEFPIPDDQFAAGGEVRLRFLNEAYGGDGSNRDRNLYIASVAVNGREVPAVELTTMSSAGVEPSAILGDYLVLFDGTADAVSKAPDEGWPAPAGAVAATPVVAEPAAPEAPAEVAEVAVDPAPVEVAVAEPVAKGPVEGIIKPVGPPPTEVAAAPAVATPEPTATAAETAAVEGAAGCALDQIYNVIGFNENSNDLTPKLQERLDQILADIGAEECVVSVVGYSSTQGDYATNALFAVERAQNVLGYLREKGLRVAKATATGAGETTQFGEDFVKNRRVVITVSP